MTYFSEKVYPFSLGLSACFRQWRAESHCRFLHGYALQFELTFATDNLDHRNWVVDFGGLKTIKLWLESMFDHTLLVAADDPELEQFKELQRRGLCDMREVRATGCEAFAELVADTVNAWVTVNAPHAWLHKVVVREHPGNAGHVQLVKPGRLI